MKIIMILLLLAMTQHCKKSEKKMIGSKAPVKTNGCLVDGMQKEEGSSFQVAFKTGEGESCTEQTDTCTCENQQVVCPQQTSFESQGYMKGTCTTPTGECSAGETKEEKYKKEEGGDCQEVSINCSCQSGAMQCPDTQVVAEGYSKGTCSTTTTGDVPNPPVSDLVMGLYDNGGEHLLTKIPGPKGGWVLLNEEYKTRPNNGPNEVAQDISSRGISVIVRLNWTFGGSGSGESTLPTSESDLQTMIDKVKVRVNATPSVKVFIVGNEPNHESQGANSGQSMSPQTYANAYVKIRAAIKSIRADAVVLAAALAPGDPIGKSTKEYMAEMKSAIEQAAAGVTGAQGWDGLAVHGKTGSSSWNEAEFFRFEDNILSHFNDNLPVYVTEANPPSWASDSSWMQSAVQAVSTFNQSYQGKIRAVIMFRWGFPNPNPNEPYQFGNSSDCPGLNDGNSMPGSVDITGNTYGVCSDWVKAWNTGLKWK